MLKKICVLLCGIIAATSLNISAFGASKNVSVTLNGELVEFDNAYPTVVNNRTLIPLRGLFEKMGYEIGWDANLKAAILTKGGSKISIRSEKKYIIVNNIQKSIDVPAQIINGWMMIPLRAVADATGAEVKWNANSKVAEIITNSGAEYALQLDGYVKQYKEAIEPLSYIDETISQLNTLNSDDSRTNIKKTGEMLEKSKELIINAINDIEDIDCGEKFEEFEKLAIENLNTQLQLISVLQEAVNGETEYAKVTAKIGDIMVKTKEINEKLSKLNL
ncbi:MAG: copper amine oxidase N-terminal domain-containing protein [Lachnospirales bacterium]